jgi:hypothetical protein
MTAKGQNNYFTESYESGWKPLVFKYEISWEFPGVQQLLGHILNASTSQKLVWDIDPFRTLRYVRKKPHMRSQQDLPNTRRHFSQACHMYWWN